MKNRKTAVLLGAAALTAALGLGYGLLTGAEQAEESSSAAGVAAFSPTGAVSVICYENEGGEIALEYLDDTWTLRRDADFPVNQTSAESMANYLAPLNATALVTQSGADLVAYGLDEPSNRIEVATDAGETCTVLVGGAEYPHRRILYQAGGRRTRIYGIRELCRSLYAYGARPAADRELARREHRQRNARHTGARQQYADGGRIGGRGREQNIYGIRHSTY